MRMVQKEGSTLNQSDLLNRIWMNPALSQVDLWEMAGGSDISGRLKSMRAKGEIGRARSKYRGGGWVLYPTGGQNEPR